MQMLRDSGETMKYLLHILALLVAMTWSVNTQAETFSIWVTGKTSMTGSTDNAFSRFDNSTGKGVEAGLELFGVSLFAEALDMGSDQLLLTGNLGWDATWGSDWRFNLGFFTGPVLMMFPNAELQTSTHSSSTSALADQGISTADVDSQIEGGFLVDEDELAKLSMGWNLIRTRLQFERRLFPGGYLGISLNGAYHLVATGEEVAAGAKHMMLDQMEQNNNLQSLDPGMGEALRADLGAEALDPGKMGGFNYTMGAYLKLQI